jgi:hypothetical protein
MILALALLALFLEQGAFLVKLVILVLSFLDSTPRANLSSTLPKIPSLESL